jgi:hypothetical protein
VLMTCTVPRTVWGVPGAAARAREAGQLQLRGRRASLERGRRDARDARSEVCASLAWDRSLTHV